MVSYQKFLKQLTKETDEEIKTFEEEVDGEVTPKTIQLTFSDNMYAALKDGEDFEVVHLLETLLKDEDYPEDIDDFFGEVNIAGTTLMGVIRDTLVGKFTFDYMESKGLDYEDYS